MSSVKFSPGHIKLAKKGRVLDVVAMVLRPAKCIAHVVLSAEMG